MPIDVQQFDSALRGMMELGVQAYFINDDPLFDRVVKEKEVRAAFLSDLSSENQRQGINVRAFST